VADDESGDDESDELT